MWDRTRFGEKVKDDATHYAMTRAKFARGEIRLLNVDGSLERAIPFDRENRESDLIQRVGTRAG
jgi:hypothetical protein